MYGKANPGAGQLTARQKRVFGIAGALVVLVLGGLGVWGAVAHDSYTGSGHGCVNLTVPSSTGGSTLHYCGSEARSFCQQAYRSQDPISLRARPQCVLAGLGPAAGASGASPSRSGLQTGPAYRSTMIVTGPSLTRATFMWAPKTPVCTRAPRSRRAVITASTKGSATGPGAAADQDGRRPLARSA